MMSERGARAGIQGDGTDGQMPDVHAAPESTAVLAIVLGHGDFASGIVSAVAQITGRGSLFLPLSNHGLSGERLEETLRAAVDASGASMVFTDLPGGSWTIAARRVQRDRPSLIVVTGVSLPMLLEVTFRDDRPAAESAQAACQRGRAAALVAALGPAASRDASAAPVPGSAGVPAASHGTRVSDTPDGGSGAG